MLEPKNAFTYPDPDLKIKTRRVYGLMLSPKLTAINGIYQIPTVKLPDYKVLGTLLGEIFFPYRPVHLRISNDHIDVDTFDARADHFTKARSEHSRPDMKFGEYGAAMLSAAGHHINGVIDIQDSWRRLKGLSEADYQVALPPQILPFWIGSKNEEDANHWFLGAMDTLGYSPLNELAARFSGVKEIQKNKDFGAIPKIAIDTLSDIFEVSFDPKAALIKMAPN